MVMTFEDMCDACPANKYFSIENISKAEREDVVLFLPEWVVKRSNLNHFLSSTQFESLCLRFNNKGEYCGWIRGKSYTQAPSSIKNLVWNRYAWQDLVSEPIHFDIMSVL